MKKLRPFALAVMIGIGMCSCDHRVTTETIVHPDGRLDKTVTFVSTDSVKNILGLNAVRGWKRTVNFTEPQGKDAKGNNTTSSITWKKSFASAAEATADLAAPSDTLLRISSSFQKSFRWFYTYLIYADTFHTANMMRLPISDYATEEDFSFIDRLPAEGKAISRADSLYLNRLNEKLFDIYGTRTLYEGYFDIHVALIKDHHLESRWLDTLKKHKERIFSRIQRLKDIKDEFLLHAMDSLHIPLPYKKLHEEYKLIMKPLTSKTNFISAVSNGKFVNQVALPWDLVRTNADSVSGDRLFWRPSSIKFLISDYTMYAESRHMNYWVVVLSALIVLTTCWQLIRHRKTTK